MKAETKEDVEEGLRERFGIEAHAQVIEAPGEGRTLVQLEGIPARRRTTVGGLERLARRIAKALGAELYGTVNLDCVSEGGVATFSMLAERD